MGLVIEFFGVPGAGKSTLWRHLKSSAPRACVFVRKDASWIPTAPPTRDLRKRIADLVTFGRISRTALCNLSLDESHLKLMDFFLQSTFQQKELCRDTSRTIRLFMQSLNVMQTVDSLRSICPKTFVIDEGLLQRGHSLHRMTGDNEIVREYFNMVSLPDIVICCTCDPDVVESRLSTRNSEKFKDLMELRKSVKQSQVALGIASDIFLGRGLSIHFIDTNRSLSEILNDLKMQVPQLDW